MSEYDHIEEHPLQGVPAEVLAVARAPVRDAAVHLAVDPEDADSIADAVVAVLRIAGFLSWPRAPWTWTGLGTPSWRHCVNCGKVIELANPEFFAVRVPTPATRQLEVYCMPCYSTQSEEAIDEAASTD